MRRCFARASLRTAPARDDKVVTAWNGLAVAALAEIGAVHRRPELVDAATRCAELVWDLHWTGDRLLRMSRDGVAGAASGVLEDYAATVEGWLVLYQAGGDRRWHDRALVVLDAALSGFADGVRWLLRHRGRCRAARPASSGVDRQRHPVRPVDAGRCVL